MTKKEAQALRLKQLNGKVHPALPLGAVQRPINGWLKAVRQALGRSLKSVGAELKSSPQAIHQLEKSEAIGTISLNQLESVAGAMGCRVVYSLVPRQGTLLELANAADDRIRRAVQHSMALEGQTADEPANPGNPLP